MIHALHGNLGSAEDWQAIEAPRIAAHDLWSYLEAGPVMTLESWGEGFARAVSGEDAEPVLLGYSMGGRLALHAMAAAPELWKGAVIVSAHPGLADEEERDRRLATDRDWAKRARQWEWPSFLKKWNAQTVLSGGSPSNAQLELASRRRAIARAFENWSLGNQQHLGGHLGACHFPVLWVTGEYDVKFTALAAELKNGVPDFEHVIVPDCGHRVIFEKPQELAAVIRDFQKRRL